MLEQTNETPPPPWPLSFPVLVAQTSRLTFPSPPNASRLAPDRTQALRAGLGRALSGAEFAQLPAQVSERGRLPAPRRSGALGGGGWGWRVHVPGDKEGVSRRFGSGPRIHFSGRVKVLTCLLPRKGFLGGLRGDLFRDSSCWDVGIRAKGMLGRSMLIFRVNKKT